MLMVSAQMSAFILTFLSAESPKMDPIFIANGKINVGTYSAQPNHYECMEEALAWLKKTPNVEEEHLQSVAILVNQTLQRGLLMASITYQKRSTSRTILVSDVHNRCKTIETGAKAVRCFLNKYPNFVIAFSIGTFQHETCLFMRRSASGEQYESVLFNPSVGARVKNVEVFLSKFNLSSMHAWTLQEITSHNMWPLLPPRLLWKRRQIWVSTVK